MPRKDAVLLSEQLRRAIDQSGLTRYRIAQETGIDESALAKFYNGHQGLSLKALDALGQCLQVTIHVGRSNPKK